MEKTTWLLIVTAAMMTGILFSGMIFGTSPVQDYGTPSYNVTVPDGQYWYGGLDAGLYDIKLTSTADVDVLVLASEADILNWTEGNQYHQYGSCYAEKVKQYSRSCKVSQGAFLVIANRKNVVFGSDAKVKIYIN